jgi:uncharacterized BrkB/YihY/UPF0761 family membrane protein
VPTALLPPIPGKPTDPAPKPIPEIAARADEAHVALGVGYRAFLRFSVARSNLLAAGNAYYLFLSLFAVLAVGYGLAAALGAERFASFLTEAVEQALPGVIGADGIDPEQLAAIGRTTSVVGAVLLLYSGTAALVAASAALHLIYGAPKDPRNLVWARVRLLGWLVVVGPLVALSYVAPGAVAGFGAEIVAELGWDVGLGQAGLTAAVLLLTYPLDLLILWILLGVLGGIRPDRAARLIGAAVGALPAVAVSLLNGAILAWSAAKPQYGALAAPIAILFLLYLLALTLFAAASLTAAVADRGLPLDAYLAVRSGD